MKDVDAFISYSSPDQKWANRLNRALADEGLATWIDRERLAAGEPWASNLKDVARNAHNIIVLVGRHGEPDEGQRREAQAVLEAVWNDPAKRVIPILMGDATPPGFVRSAVGGEVQAIRIGDPRRDWNKAMQDLVRVLKSEAPLEEISESIDTKSEDRALQQERLSYIRTVAERFDKGSSGE